VRQRHEEAPLLITERTTMPLAGRHDEKRKRALADDARGARHLDGEEERGRERGIEGGRREDVSE